MKTALFGLAACAATLSFALPATAATESLEVQSGTLRAVQIQYFGPVAQSFTAFSDTLTSVGFQFETINPGSANVPISFNLYAGETLTGTSLYSGAFDLPFAVPTTPTWYDIALPDVAVTDGATYSLVLNSTSARTAVALGPDYNIYNGQPLGPDAYAGGHAFANRILYPNCTGPNNNCDLNFRLTGESFDTAPGVPEPDSWALLILGFGVVGGALRGSRRQRVELIFA